MSILVPTDFSSQASHALQWAVRWSSKLDKRITLMHSYVLPVYATDLPIALPNDMDLEKDSETALHELVVKIGAQHPDIHFSTLAVPGYAEDEIVQVAESLKCDSVIMGTHGASGMREWLVGTVTGSVLAHATCPVIVVPESSVMKPLDKMVFATSYEEGDFEHIERFLHYASLWNAEVVLLHVTPGKWDKTYEFDAIERLKVRLQEESGYTKLRFKLLDAEDVYEALIHYMEEVDADLLGMTHRHRSWMDRVLERSMSKKMSFHSSCPLMVFPPQ